MARRESIAREAARAECAKHPDMPSRTLAKRLRQLEPQLFSSIEHARGFVRLVRGVKGKRDREWSADKSLFRAPAKPGSAILPKGMSQAVQDLELGKGKYLLMSDIHSPYHDERVVETAIRIGVNEGCDAIYLNGDTADCYSISRWEKDPRQRDLHNEILTTRDLLRYIRPHFDRAYFKYGNHDDRWALNLWRQCDQLALFKEFELSAVLHLPELQYEVVQSKQKARMGELVVIHGHEVKFSSSVNPAMGLWLRMGSSAIAGHLHRSSTHSENNPTTRHISTCWSMGCCCDLAPEYASINNWNWGFSIVSVGDRGEFQVSNFKVSKDYEVFRS